MIARDLVGYGEFLPHPAWPGDARIAVNFNLNIEGGGESTLANGDTASEGLLNDIGVGPQIGRRVPLVESVRSFGEVLDGKHDDLPEQAFYMVGGIEEAAAKAEQLRTQQ